MWMWLAISDLVAVAVVLELVARAPLQPPDVTWD
jgi:hypothetical protein